jgi:hypothetical protein
MQISVFFIFRTPLIRSTSNVKEGLLRWCQSQVAGYPVRPHFFFLINIFILYQIRTYQ